MTRPATLLLCCIGIAGWSLAAYLAGAYEAPGEAWVTVRVGR